MPSRCIAQVIGHVGSVTPASGKGPHSITVAVSDPQGWRKQQRGELEGAPMWCRCKWFSTNDPKVNKGDLVLMTGSLYQEWYQSKDGDLRSSIEVMCQEQPLVLQRKAGAGDMVAEKPTGPAFAGVDDELPF